MTNSLPVPCFITDKKFVLSNIQLQCFQQKSKWQVLFFVQKSVDYFSLKLLHKPYIASIKSNLKGIFILSSFLPWGWIATCPLDAYRPKYICTSIRNIAMQIHSSSAVWVTGAKGEYLCYYLHSSGFYRPTLHRENTVSFLDKYSFFLFRRQSQPFPGGLICLLSLAVPPHDRSLVDWSKPLSM